MKRLHNILLGVLFAFLVTGCGQTVIETLNVPAPPAYNAPGSGKSVVILPFADYSFADNLGAAHRRNMTVTESLTDRLVANGFGLPVQEDVFQYMVEQNIISLVPYEGNYSNSLTNELSGDWTPEMKEYIRFYIAQQQQSRDNRLAASPGTHGLNTKTLKKIGRKFQADYIVRGRILEYKTRQETTWMPWKKGLLPFISGTASQFLYGFAGSDRYDEINQMVTGAIIGARMGDRKSDWPFDDDKGLTIAGSAADMNTIFWGLAGTGFGKQAYNSGRVDQAVVQMRIWVQEAATGNVVWTNRIDVKVTPETIWADAQYDTLFNKAIDKGVTTLIDNFVSYGL